MKPASVLLLLCAPFAASGQWLDNFSDGDFTANPAWTGDTAYWQVTGDRLQSHYTGDDPSVFYLSTPSTSLSGTSWTFWVQLHFNPSSRNYVEAYLASDREDPRCPCDSVHGYFVRIGDTPDQVALYRRNGLRDTLLISGREGITDHSNNILKIKVTCDKHHEWSLYDDASGSGENYFREGTATDSAFLQSAWFSIVVHQSGKTAEEKHFFDDIRVEPFFPDTTAPVLEAIFPEDSQHISLQFDEPVKDSSARNLLHYSADGGLIMPDSAALDQGNRRLVHLYFENEILATKIYHLRLKHILDLSGNETDTTASFIYYAARPYDVIIDEIFPDPTPSQGLPEFEYVEIKNRSPYPVNLDGWQFCDPTRCTVFPALMLPPDSLLILCDPEAVAAFQPFGRTITLPGFPSLNNAGDLVLLRNKNGDVIHSVAYSAAWYGDSSGSEGGRSLEMADERFPCVSGGNWNASTATAGGTPGTPNTGTPFTQTPVLAVQWVRVTDSANIIAGFNLQTDSLTASVPETYTIPGMTIDSASAQGPLFDQVHIHLATPLQHRKMYTLKINALTGCGGIRQGMDDEARFGLTEPAEKKDVVINEILFNPRADGRDFVELYNRSPKIIGVGTLQMANRNINREVAARKTITSVPHYLFPGDYLALTDDKDDLLKRYDCKILENILEVAALPEYPNTGGSVVLTDTAGNIIDEVDYDETEQSAFFHNEEGVSLERISAGGESNNPANWHSASSAAGYATPGYLNSQSGGTDTLGQAFSVSPEIFSPDHDGTDDDALIQYHLPDGFAGEVLIFNADGRPIRHLVTHALLGTHGVIKWDGRDDNLNTLPVGVYIIYVRIFNTRGTVRHYKLPVVLAKRR